jgi:hypothetical protein
MPTEKPLLKSLALMASVIEARAPVRPAIGRGGSSPGEDDLSG